MLKSLTKIMNNKAETRGTKIIQDLDLQNIP